MCGQFLIMHQLSGTAKDSIFVRPTQPDQLYKVRDGIKFHLFINTAPCGDARIFSPHETEIGVDKHPNRLVSGTQAKIKCILQSIFYLSNLFHFEFRIAKINVYFSMFIRTVEKHVVSYAQKSSLAREQYRLKAVMVFKHGMA